MKKKKITRQEIFKLRIKRIIYLYKKLDKGEHILVKNICIYFNISERTLRRDIKVLRDVLEEEIFIDKEGGYYIDI